MSDANARSKYAAPTPPDRPNCSRCATCAPLPLAGVGTRFDIGPGCPNGIERIDAGLLSYDSDVTRADTALEAGLDRYCALDAPIEAIGIEALRAQAARGVTRRISGLNIDGEAVPGIRGLWPIEVGGERVGSVTSAAWSPRLGTNVALAMLSTEHGGLGTEVMVTTPDGPRTATVAAVPFGDPVTP